MKKFENFSAALENLRLCRNYEPPYDVVTKTGNKGNIFNPV